MRTTGTVLATLCLLTACGGQEAEKTSAPPPAAKAPAAAPAAPQAAAAKPKPAPNPVIDERRSGTMALRDADIRTALALTPDQVAKLEKLGNGSFHIPPKQIDLAYAVLTPAQHQVLRQQMMKRNAQPLTMVWLQAYLGLDDVQKAKIQTILTTQGVAAQQIVKRAELSPEQKATEVTKLIASVAAASLTVLTPEQLAKMKALEAAPAS